MSRLSRILGSRRFRLPHFEPAGLRFDEIAELILHEPVLPDDPSSNVVRLPRQTPTAGELRQSIERHLQARDATPPAREAISPADELRNALAELRQSLG